MTSRPTDNVHLTTLSIQHFSVFSLQKDFKIPKGEQPRLSFRADFYNAVNHPEFGGPNSDPTVGNLGTVTYTAINNRTVQLGLHLYF